MTGMVGLGVLLGGVPLLSPPITGILAAPPKKLAPRFAVDGSGMTKVVASGIGGRA